MQNSSGAPSTSPAFTLGSRRGEAHSSARKSVPRDPTTARAGGPESGSHRAGFDAPSPTGRAEPIFSLSPVRLICADYPAVGTTGSAREGGQSAPGGSEQAIDRGSQAISRRNKSIYPQLWLGWWFREGSQFPFAPVGFPSRIPSVSSPGPRAAVKIHRNSWRPGNPLGVARIVRAVLREDPLRVYSAHS